MAHKMRQTLLPFRPVAVFPERRADGAAIVAGPLEAPREEAAIGPDPALRKGQGETCPCKPKMK